MKKSMIKAFLAATAVTCMLTGTAYAEETTAPLTEDQSLLPQETISRNGAIDIFLPTTEWREVSYDDCCVAFSDGTGMILFDHYQADDTVKKFDTSEADAYYYETIEVHNGAKYVFAAYANNKEDLDLIKIAIANAKVNEAAIPADEKHEVVTENYSVEPADYIAYVTASELNVRPQGNGNAAPIGSVYYASEVHVTGKILLNGAPNGWVQIDFNGGTGYVSSDFLSDTKPAGPQPTPTPQPTPETEPGVRIIDTIVTYSASGEYHELYVYSDEAIMDNNGDSYHGGPDAWTNDRTGEVFTANMPQTEGAPTIVNTIVTYSASGEYHEIYVYSDEAIMDNNGDSYHGGPDAWTNDRTGEVFTANMPQTERVCESSFPADNANGETVQINIYSDGSVYDDNGNPYSSTEDGGWQNINTGEVYFQH